MSLNIHYILDTNIQDARRAGASMDILPTLTKTGGIKGKHFFSLHKWPTFFSYTLHIMPKSSDKKNSIQISVCQLLIKLLTQTSQLQIQGSVSNSKRNLKKQYLQVV